MSEPSNSTHGSGESTRFLNVDLELRSQRPLDALLSHWADSVIVLRNSVDGGIHTVWVELSREFKSAVGCIAAFLELIETLGGPPLELWRGCQDRCFNIGIQGGVAPLSLEIAITPELLGRVAAVNVRLAVTVYSTANDR